MWQDLSKGIAGTRCNFCTTRLAERGSAARDGGTVLFGRIPWPDQGLKANILVLASLLFGVSPSAMLQMPMLQGPQRRSSGILLFQRISKPPR